MSPSDTISWKCAQFLTVWYFILYFIITLKIVSMEGMTLDGLIKI